MLTAEKISGGKILDASEERRGARDGAQFQADGIFWLATAIAA
jgi:hypothetical protein